MSDHSPRAADAAQSPVVQAEPTEREKFERAFKHLDFTPYPDKWSDRIYLFDHVHSLWEGWRGRAALSAAAPVAPVAAWQVTNESLGFWASFREEDRALQLVADHDEAGYRGSIVTPLYAAPVVPVEPAARHLLDLLAGMEWVQPAYNGSPSCPSCGRQQHIGHAEDCDLAAALAALVARIWALPLPGPGSPFQPPAAASTAIPNAFSRPLGVDGFAHGAACLCSDCCHDR